MAGQFLIGDFFIVACYAPRNFEIVKVSRVLFVGDLRLRAGALDASKPPIRTVLRFRGPRLSVGPQYVKRRRLYGG